jgi:hypothetical protein
VAPRDDRQADAGPTLPVFERLAPPPPPALVARRIEALSRPGDIVVDLHGRGGWFARAAIDRQRSALTIESSPLARLLAELVLRPPDLRHLDAAFAAVGSAPRGETSVRAWISDRWATRCPTCERTVVLDEVVWERPPSDPDGLADPVRRTFRCPSCREARSEVRHMPPDDADRERARSAQDEADAAVARGRLRERFPVLDGEAHTLVDELLDLHSPRQLAGLAAILERIESDLRAAPVEAALRVAFLHAVLPASRLNAFPGRVGAVRIANGRLRTALTGAWRERNPWLAFEDGYRLVRTFLQRLEAAPLPPVQARYAPDLRAVVEGSGNVVVRLAGASTYRGLATEADELDRSPRPEARRRVRLVVSIAPPRPTPERLALAYHGTAWALGGEAAVLLPLERLFGGPTRVPWTWQSAALRRSLEAAAPLVHGSGDARAVVLVGAAPEAIVAAAIAAAGARYRLAEVGPAADTDTPSTILELVPPGAALPPGPRTRANVPLDPVPGGPGDPDLIPASGLFQAPEPIEGRPFSRSDAERTVTETAAAVLRARGEPATFELLLGEILLGLDRAGLLRRFALEQHGPAGGEPAGERAASPDDPVEDLLSLIRDELGRPTQRRIVPAGPGRWWLADRTDREQIPAPLSDRVEWATYSLLSTGGPLTETAFRDRIAALFRGADRPDDALVTACLASYRAASSTPERLTTEDDVAARSHEHAELVALVAETGHRLGLDAWISATEQARRLGARRLGDWLEPEERTAWLGSVAPGRPESLAEVDVAWYARGRLALLFEIEWTAMLAEPLLGRHALIPPDERVVRFLVIPPERSELVRAKLDASPLLRSIVEAQNWHFLKWNHLRTFACLEHHSHESLEQILGLDPAVERAGEQLALFGIAPSGAERDEADDGAGDGAGEPAPGEVVVGRAVDAGSAGQSGDA